MASYPDWVMKHKVKGTYINKVGDKYYLYAAHSERIKGTNKVRRVSDGYLGRITEKDGLIPPKDKVVGDDISSYEFGLSYVILKCSEKIHLGLRKSFVKYGDLIYCCSILHYIYGFHSKELFLHSYLSILFKEVTYPDSFTDAQVVGIERGKRMINETLNRLFDADLPLIKASFSLLTLVSVNKRFYLSKAPESVTHYCDKYSIRLEDTSWQK